MASDTGELLSHVKDATAFHLPGHTTIEIPQPFYDSVTGTGFVITKFMVLEVVAALLIVLIFVPLARRIRSGEPPKGRWWNFFEAMLLFVRDEVARPAIGGKDADRFLPFVWTLFFFILFCNLMGMLPWCGTPTGALGTTAALAMVTFGVVLISGTKQFGVVGFWLHQVPHMDLPLAIAIVIKPMIFCIEVMGLFMKHAVLAIRLLANMFAGHVVLAVIIGFIASTAHFSFAGWSGITFASIFGATAISLLELFVAFLQAYIFAFLSSLFIGMAIHEH
jgi:F-type H+-transporting ATPase subunit a